MSPGCSGSGLGLRSSPLSICTTCPNELHLKCLHGRRTDYQWKICSLNIFIYNDTWSLLFKGNSSPTRKALITMWAARKLTWKQERLRVFQHIKCTIKEPSAFIDNDGNWQAMSLSVIFRLGLSWMMCKNGFCSRWIMLMNYFCTIIQNRPRVNGFLKHSWNERVHSGSWSPGIV